MPQPNRRKTYLINPRFQWRFIGFMAVVSLLAISILYVSNVLFFRNMKQEALAVGRHRVVRALLAIWTESGTCERTRR